MSPTLPRAPVVTVDGPAGSGKTTLGRRLALALGMPLIDTGLFYRAVMAAAVRTGVGPGQRDRIPDLARRARIEINTDPRDETWQVRVDGVSADDIIREPRHAHLLGIVSQTPAVRAHLLAPQRAAAVNGGVAVGRDCGTVVFPDALVKLYLEATETVRRARRAEQLRERGAANDALTLRGEIAERDRIDAPAMGPAPEAIIIDTGRLTIEEMVELALRHCAAVGLVAVEPRP
jgi:cytidylate kinase